MAKTTKSTGQTATETAATGFLELPLDQIIVENQIRTEIDREEEAFQAMKKSIEQMGLLEPPLVERCATGYRLLAGERRLLACKELGMTTIPARVLENVTGQAHRISIQLIENLLRKDLNPIDQANACVGFFQAQEEGVTLDKIIGDLTTFEMTPERFDEDFAENVAAIVNCTAKSNRSVINCLTLLRLPEEVQNGLKTGAVSPSIGYVFAANLDCPNFSEVYQKFLENPLTVKALQSRFKYYKDTAKGGKTKQATKKPFQGLSASLKSTRAVIEKNLAQDAATYTKSDVEQLLAELEQLQAFLKEKLPTLPEGGTGETAADKPAATGSEAAASKSDTASTGKTKKSATPKKVVS